MLATSVFGAEVLELEVLELRAQLGPDILLGLLGELPDLPIRAATESAESGSDGSDDRDNSRNGEHQAQKEQQPLLGTRRMGLKHGHGVTSGTRLIQAR
ncbi:hypothetical protein GCM10010289_80640 [Streptomyces violascens]|uniref:Uncharacterized protein n=1 Tax=Streptomyces violascens TaxID=67381 RepID=A0ABQ3QSE2_9ACTN|nr:hypothetical protein GCM10010289_80640 [Streptomyces violascens]GHI40155.1 hypothetical protein Sviol_45630 [Streptomyces violascens]